MVDIRDLRNVHFAGSKALHRSILDSCKGSHSAFHWALAACLPRVSCCIYAGLPKAIAARESTTYNQICSGALPHLMILTRFISTLGTVMQWIASTAS